MESMLSSKVMAAFEDDSLVHFANSFSAPDTSARQMRFPKLSNVVSLRSRPRTLAGAFLLVFSFLVAKTPGAATSDEFTFKTFAGTSLIGSADGVGGFARFWRAAGIAISDSGTLFVADSLNHTIRKITSAGVVTTLAGTAGTIGSAD